jgi:gamma-glutamyltranspeptidase/glutathione hydrolase
MRKRRVWRGVLSLLLVLMLVLPAGVWAQTASGVPKAVHHGWTTDEGQVAHGKYGMVATAHPLASKVGAEVLKRGGNAVDAAVAIQFVLNVVEPQMSGIGGGGFMMVYDAKTKKVSIIDSRERAPQSARPDMFLDEKGQEIPFPVRSTQGYAVGVPGTLKGLQAALDKWGTKPMAELIQPAILLAERGVKVNWVLARDIAACKERLSRSAAKDVFLPNGEPLKEGDLLVQKDLAKTFRLIQAFGPDVFYQGKVGQALVQTVNAYGGHMTMNDLKRYHITVDKPLEADFHGYHVVTMPPPSSGGVTIMYILKLLEEKNAWQTALRSPERYHLMTEAMHLAYADRGAYIGDPEFVDVPVQGMLDPRYIKERAALIDLNKANSDVRPGDPWKYQQSGTPNRTVKQPDNKHIGQTTHFTVADRWGNLVSYTTTIEQEFGTGIMVPGYGFMLNNEMTDFDAVPGGPNQAEPNKRPMSSMSPTIVFKDGKPVMTVGSPGGPTIIASVFQVLMYTLVDGLDIKSAIEEPRIYSNKYPKILWEDGVPDAARKRMTQMGHQFESSPQSIGNVQSIVIDPVTGAYTGAADSSREGWAVGLN